jgi:DNA-binding MarR family transcriptional regulator
MKTSPSNTSLVDTDRLADFVLFTQRSCILNLSSELHRGNVSFPQFFLLAYLSSEDYLTMSDIAKKMGHSTAAATGLVDRLEKLNYVERMHAAEDRRKIMVRITQKGTELVARMRGEIASNLSDVMSEMDEEEADIVAHANRAIAGRSL